MRTLDVLTLPDGPSQIHSKLSCHTEGTSRVVGGYTAKQYTWRWIVKFKNFGCAGTIIHPNFVVTAAHCCNGVGEANFDPATFAFYTNKYTLADDYDQREYIPGKYYDDHKIHEKGFKNNFKCSKKFLNFF